MIGRKTKGIICILIAAAGFSLMSAFVRLAGELPSFQKAFFRNLFALPVVSVILLSRRISVWPQRRNVKFLLCRAGFGTVGLLCNFYAIDHMVLADANILNKLSPFFAILFSVFLLKERPKAIQLLGVAVAFVGSVFIVRPGFSEASVFPSVMGIVGGMGAGIAYTFVRKLGMNGENSFRIVFWFSAFSCVVCVPFMLADFVPLTPLQLTYLILAAVCACIGQFGITQAYVFAPAREISVYDYTQVVFAAILGFFLFDQALDIWNVIGYLLISGAGVGMFLYNRRQKE